MTSQTGKNRPCWRRAAKGAVASSALAVGLLMGLGSATAHADILDQVGENYMQGAGGGQISNFVKEALTLRGLGFKPSKSNLEALQAGWDYLPNQSRLVAALQSTVAYQRKLQAQLQNAKPQQGFNAGVGQLPPGMGPTQPPGVPPEPGGNTGAFLGPSGGINQPIG
jgi:hypothetical protein